MIEITYTHIYKLTPTLGYAKQAIHPPKISTPKFQEISLVILQKERGVIEKKYMLKKHRKNMRSNHRA
jgi:hypothetical protein